MIPVSTPISTGAFFDRARLAIGGLRARAERLQGEVAGGERLTRSSDDPVAASRLRQLAQADAFQRIDTANADRASADLSLTDSALGAFADFVARARELALQAANGTLSDGQRAALGTELVQIHGNMVALANSRDSAGHALFGGEAAGDAYALDAAGNALYTGTATSPELDLGDGVSVTRGLTGPEFLTVNGNGLLALVKQLGAALQGGAADPRAAAQSSLAALEAGTTAISTAQAVVGSRLSWTALTVERQQRLGDARAIEQASLGGTDLAGVIAQLQQTMLVLEASQASFARLASISLFEVLR